MIQHNATRRLHARAHFKSLLLVSLFATSGYAQLPAPLMLPPNDNPVVSGMPPVSPSLNCTAPCPALHSSTQPNAALGPVASPLRSDMQPDRMKGRTAGWLGLNRRQSALVQPVSGQSSSSQSSSSQASSGQASSSQASSGQASPGVVQAQFASLPEVPAQARKSSRSSGSVNNTTQPSDVAPAFLPESETAAVIGAPVPAVPLSQSESLLDVDLSGGNQSRAISRPASEVAAKPSPLTPVAPSKKASTATHFSLRDDDPSEAEAPKTKVTSTIVRIAKRGVGIVTPEITTPPRPLIEKAAPTLVEIHEGFAPRRAQTPDVFHVSDKEADSSAAVTKTDANTNVPLRLVKQTAPTLPATAANVPLLPQQPTTAQPPTAQPSISDTPELSQATTSQATTSQATTSQATTGQAISGSEPSRALPLAMATTTAPPVAGSLNSTDAGLTPSIAASSQRQLSLKIGTTSPAAPTVPARPTEKRRTTEPNPIALSEPIVKAVKQAAVPIPVSETRATLPVIAQTSHALEAADGTSSAHRESAAGMDQAIKAKYPGSRIQVKADEEGLIVDGIAASESEAAKILAFVRTSTLCPVTDRVITKR